MTYLKYFIDFMVISYVSFQILGDVLCQLIPFIQNMSILANSFTLVLIAFDRYLAVSNCIKLKWQPELLASSIICIFIWAFAIMIAIKSLFSYKNYLVLILITDPGHPLVPIDAYPAYMCMAEKVINRKYYVIVFAYAFIPTTLVFTWLNTIIAKRIWDRRHPVKNQKKVSEHKLSVSSSSDMVLKNKNSETATTSLDGNYRKVMTVSDLGNSFYIFRLQYIF